MPKAEVMLAVVVVLLSFFYTQFLCAILFKNIQLPNESAIHVPSVNGSCREIEPVFQERVGVL